MDQPIMNNHPSNSMIKIVFTLLVALAIPISVTLVQQRQDIRQHAAEKETTVTPEPTRGHTRPPVTPIHGYVYVDANHNTLRDFEEKGAPGIPIAIVRKQTKKHGVNQTPQTITVTTDSNGFFTVTPDGLGNMDDLYTATITLPPGYKASITSSLTINGSSNAVMEFGIFPSADSTTPTPTTTACIPRPQCLDATPRCLVAEPAHGWCPQGQGKQLPTTPAPTRSR